MRLLRANLGGIPEVGIERVSGRKSNTARVNRAAYNKNMWLTTRPSGPRRGFEIGSKFEGVFWGVAGLSFAEGDGL